MQRARHELLARPAFAADEHGRLRLTDTLQKVIHFFHGWARAEQLVEAPGLVHGALQALDFTCQHPVLDCAFDGDRNDVDVEGLGDEVVSSRADRLHRGFHTAKSGDHDHR
jgi:hypothetical protein